MKKYLSEHKTGLIIAAVLLILAVFAICFYSPVRIQEPNMVAYGKDGEKLEFELYIKWHRRLFSEDKAMGSVIIDGVNYETPDKGRVDGFFFLPVENSTDNPYELVKLTAQTPKLKTYTVSITHSGDTFATIYSFPQE